MAAPYRACAGSARDRPRHPSVFNTGESSFVEGCCPLRSPPQCAYPLMTCDEHNKDSDRQQEPPSGDDAGTNGQPCHAEKDDACDEPHVANNEVEPLVTLDHLVAGLQAVFVLLGGLHFSGAQVFTSEDMFPKSEFKPEPRPTRPPRTDRINVLDASSGSAATLRQKSSQLPSCCRYCSTLER